MPYTYAPPAVTDLNLDQQMAFSWDESKDVLILTGCPGSGKTTVAMLRNGGQDCANRKYAVYANLLLGYLLNSAKDLNVPESFFQTFHSWAWQESGGWNPPADKPQMLGESWDRWFVRWSAKQTSRLREFTLDEGQDLPLEVRCSLTHFTETLVISMDEAQDVRSECEGNELLRTMNYLQSTLGKTVSHFKLSKNWRNTKSVFEFSRAIVPEMNALTQGVDFDQGDGEKPQLFKFDSSEDYFDELIAIIRNATGLNVAVLCDSLNQLRILHKTLGNAGFDTTKFDSSEFKKIRGRAAKNTFLKGMSNIVLSTFQSCKGLEFDVVVLADVAGMSDDLSKRKGYYVGCTRARSQLVLLFDRSSGDMPNWLQQFELSKLELFETILS